VRGPTPAWVRPAVGAAVLLLLLRQLGSEPFLDGLRAVDAGTLGLGLLLAVPVTLCCAWRWSVVAHALGARLPMSAAVASSYRAQLLNTTLPGGVLGDLHRGVSHGRSVGDPGRGLRGVAWERFTGQVIQVCVTLVVLSALPSPVRAALPTAAVAAGLVAMLAVVVVAAVARHVPGGVVSRTLRGARTDMRRILARRFWPPLVLASALAVACHVATFLVAARAAGVSASPVRVLPLALLILVAMAFPLNVAGWGPREGVSAWAFASAGLTADRGVATAVVYGVMVLVGSLPGAVVLVAGALHRRSGGVTPAEPMPKESLHG
jgi:glycosyltransferase 2 family protein